MKSLASHYYILSADFADEYEGAVGKMYRSIVGEQGAVHGACLECLQDKISADFGDSRRFSRILPGFVFEGPSGSNQIYRRGAENAEEKQKAVHSLLFVLLRVFRLFLTFAREQRHRGCKPLPRNIRIRSGAFAPSFAASRLRVGEDQCAPSKTKHLGLRHSHGNTAWKKCFLRIFQLFLTFAREQRHRGCKPLPQNIRI